jgi:hypothetical protein
VEFCGLSCQGARQRFEVGIASGVCSSRLARSTRVVESEVACQGGLSLFDAPAPLLDGHHVVAPTATGHHSNLDAMFFQQLDKPIAGERTALVGVEDLRNAKAVQHLLYGIPNARDTDGRLRAYGTEPLALGVAQGNDALAADLKAFRTRMWYQNRYPTTAKTWGPPSER